MQILSIPKFVVIICFLIQGMLMGTTFTVNSTGDEADGDPGDGVCDTGNAEDGFTGICTLRAAILEANANPEVQSTIVFNIGSGTPTIFINGLPEITAPGVTIDGATGGASRIILNGSGQATNPALWISTGGVTIKNLIIHSFPQGGIVLAEGDDFGSNKIEGTWIGIDANGASRPNGKLSLFIESDQNMIGGADEAARNVIDGIGVFGSENTFENNYIGIAPDGSSPLNADSDGLTLLFGASHNVVRNNVISGAGRRGIAIWDAYENEITENYIGLDKDGTSAVPNGMVGIFILEAHNNRIMNNVVSGSLVHGISIVSGSDNRISGNIIGLNAAGTAAVGNHQHGIYMEEAAGNIIGGEVVEDRNVISGNGGDGVKITRKFKGTDENLIAGNFIGTAADGLDSLGNAGHGVHIVGASNNIIGRKIEDGGSPNLIAHNNGDGVRVVNIFVGTSIIISESNAILSNSIHSNAGLGIDLGGDGVTENPPPVFPNFPNRHQPFPVITSVRTQNGTTTINGFLQISESDEFLIYLIELFANGEPDPSEHGQGEFFLGRESVTIGEFGRAYFSFEAAGEFDNISATATDQNFNTSEFAKHPGDIVVTVTGDEEDADLTDGICDTDPDILGDICTLRAAIQQANVNYDGNGRRQRITFNIEPSLEGFTIKPGPPLPDITVPVSIDATTQPGAHCNAWPPQLVVEIDGSEIEFGDGLVLRGGESTIRGLVINNYEVSAAIGISSDNNTIACNFLGTDVTGTESKENRHGVSIFGSQNKIGGGTLPERNLISGNDRIGISVLRGLENKIEGNYIGTDVTGVGNSEMGNRTGISVLDNSPLTRIGGNAETTGMPPGNVISGNERNGIVLSGDEIYVQGNLIGLDASGESDVGNGWNGIFILGGKNNIIGDEPGSQIPGAGNRIAFNKENGIELATSETFGTPLNNTILGNSIFLNEGLGIDLGGDGVTPNDPGDLDDGPNKLFNFPVISDLERLSVSELLFTVNLDTNVPNEDVIVEFFGNVGCDPSGHGQGQIPLGRRTVNIGGDGTVSFDHTLNISECSFITATATDPEGNTSEFSACGVLKSDCLSIVEVQFWHQPPGEDPVETHRTVDGNHVVIKTLVENKAASPLGSNAQIFEINSARNLTPEPLEIIYAPGQVTTFEHPWNTLRFAWEDDANSTLSIPFSDRRVNVGLYESTDNGIEIIDALATDVTVIPRPVIMVHGLWSSHETWNFFKPMFPAVHPEWEGWAIGDGKAPGIMNTGIRPSLTDPVSYGTAHTTTTIAENAVQLNNYIAGVRDITDAQHVDIVAGSMGGLIARHYVDRLMPNTILGDPVVKQMIMLGTPNLGSPCANLWMSLWSLPNVVISAAQAFYIPPPMGIIGATVGLITRNEMLKKSATNVYQLTPEYVQGTFNRRIRDQKGVPFHTFVGDSFWYTCQELYNYGDVVVSLNSALANTYPHVLRWNSVVREPVQHEVLNKVPGSFLFVREILSNTPGTNTPQTQGLVVQEETDIESTSGSVNDPQIIASLFVPVAPGEPTPVVFPLSGADAFGASVLVQGENSVRMRITNPSEIITDVIERDAAANFVTYNVLSPDDGKWVVELEHEQESDTLYVPLVAWQYGGSLMLDFDVAAGNPSDRMQIRASIMDDGVPVTGAEVFATVVSTSDTTVTEVELFDDGEHGDGEKDDGVYGNVTELLPLDTYIVGVWANIDGQFRGAHQIVHFTGTNDTTGVNLSLSKISSPEIAEIDEEIVYTLRIYNAGPEPATGLTLSDPLPEGMTFVSAATPQGSCAVENDIVHCEVGELAVDETVIVEITVTTSEPGFYTNDATVFADQSDRNPSLNSSRAITEVVISTGLNEPIDIPDEFALHQAYPNPFNAETIIRYDVKDNTHVVLQVFDILGRPVAVLVNEEHTPGRYEAVFNAGRLASGVYLYRIEMGEFQKVKSMLLIK